MALRLPPLRRPKPPYPDRVSPRAHWYGRWCCCCCWPECLQCCCPHVLLVQRPPARPVPLLGFCLPCRPNAPSPLLWPLATMRGAAVKRGVNCGPVPASYPRRHAIAHRRLYRDPTHLTPSRILANRPSCFSPSPALTLQRQRAPLSSSCPSPCWVQDAPLHRLTAALAATAPCARRRVAQAAE